MKNSNAQEALLISRRLKFLELSDPVRGWNNPDHQIPPRVLDREFEDVNTLEKLISSLTEINGREPDGASSA